MMTNQVPMPTGKTIEQPKRIPDALGNLESLSERVHNSISTLEGRLDTIMRKEPANGGGCGQACPPTPIAFGERIEIVNKSLDHALTRLDKIMAMLEL